MFESALDCIISIDHEGSILEFNAAAEKIFRCPAAQAVGSPLDRFIPARFREKHRSYVRRFGEAGVTMRRMGAELVLSGLREDGEAFPIDASISHTSVRGRKFYTVILRDITGRRRRLLQRHLWL